MRIKNVIVIRNDGGRKIAKNARIRRCLHRLIVVSSKNTEQCKFKVLPFVVIILSVIFITYLSFLIKNYKISNYSVFYSIFFGMEVVIDVVIPNHHSRMMERLNRMRLEGRYCDIHFRVGDSVFPAHRVVLAAQADFFRDIFNINILEHEGEEIVLNNVDINVLQQALNFIYVRQNHIVKVPAA